MRLVMITCSLVLGVLVAYPIIYLAIFSLTVDGQLSLDNYLHMFTSSRYAESFLNTAVVGVLVTLIASAFGIFMGWAVTRTNMPWKQFIRNFSFVPFLVPSYVGAMAYVFLFGPRAGYVNEGFRWLFHTEATFFNVFSLTGLALVMSFYCFPLVFLQVTSALDSLDPSLEEAAQISGASRLRTVYRITIPIITPAIINGAILVFVFAIALFGAPLIIAQAARIWVLTTRIFAFFSPPPNFGLASALSTMLIFLVVLALIGQQMALRLGSGRAYTTITGKVGAKQVSNLGGWRFLVLGGCLLIFFLAVILPLMTMLVISLFKIHGHGFSSGLTLEHYWQVLTSKFCLRAIKNSLILAFGTATLCSLIALVLAYIEVRTKAPGKGVLRFLTTMPLAIPGTVMGVGVLLAWSRGFFNLYGTLIIILIALMARFITFGYQTLCASLRQLDPALEEAARISGATWGQTMRKIVLPLIKDGFLSAWILIFIPSVGELAATVMLFTSQTVPVSVAMFDSFSEGVFQQVAALSIFVLVLIVLIFFVFRRFLGIRFAPAQS